VHILAALEKNVHEVAYDKFYTMDPVGCQTLVVHSSILINNHDIRYKIKIDI